MSRSKWGIGIVVIVLAGMLAGPMPLSRCLARYPKQQPQQQPDTQEPQAPDEYKSSGDPDDNIMTLLKERLETLRQREDYVRKGYAAGKQTQHDVDRASLAVLWAQLDVLDKPSLRIATLEKMVAIHIRQEKEVQQESAAKLRPSNDVNSINAFLSAQGNYSRAKIDRIDAQLRLERERSALKKEVAEQSADSKTAKSDDKEKAK